MGCTTKSRTSRHAGPEVLGLTFHTSHANIPSMDKVKNTQSEDVNTLTQDDMDVLEVVLKQVRGSYPGSPYRQADLMDAAPEA